MKLAYDSQILRAKLWIKPPLCKNKDGKVFPVAFTFNFYIDNSALFAAFIRYNQKKYPDLHFVGIVQSVESNGIKRSKAPIDYYKYN